MPKIRQMTRQYFKEKRIAINVTPHQGGGDVLRYKRIIYWGCAAGRIGIFTTGLTIMGSHFQELLEWGRTFSGFGGKKVLHIYG